MSLLKAEVENYTKRNQTKKCEGVTPRKERKRRLHLKIILYLIFKFLTGWVL